MDRPPPHPQSLALDRPGNIFKIPFLESSWYQNLDRNRGHFSTVAKWRERVWGGKSTRDKTFLSPQPLLGPTDTQGCLLLGPSDPLSGEMRRLCHNSAAPTSYHPFHKHLRCSRSFIIDAWGGQSNTGCYKDEGMRSWTRTCTITSPQM